MGDRSSRDLDVPQAASPTQERKPTGTRGPLFRLLDAIGNRGALTLIRPSVPAAPVALELRENRPWLAELRSPASDDAIAQELYGDAGVPVEHADVFAFGGPDVDAVTVIPELLREPYRSAFHTRMDALLERDLRWMKDQLFEWRIGGSEERALVDTVAFWARRKDLRTQAGRSYFDVFVGRLQSDTWYRDYGAWEGARQSFLDLLYDEVEEKKGELYALITTNSVEYGGYRPGWSAYDVTGRPTAAPATELPASTASQGGGLMMDALVGYTSDDDSRIIVDALTKVPPPVQAAVLRQFLSRLGERDFTGLFSRSGEPTESAMLFWLFEDLEADDRKRLAASVRENGVLTPDAVDALASGRGWFARTFPWTSHQAKGAAEYWADVANNASGAKKVGAGVLGTFATLWTPEVGGFTLTTLLGARFLPAFAKVRGVGATLAVAGTGLTSFNVTLTVGELARGRNAWTGEPLSDEEVLGRVLNLAANAVLIGAGVLYARVPPAPSGGAPSGALPGTPGRTPLLGQVPDEDVIMTGRVEHNAATGELRLYLRHRDAGYWETTVNPATGNGRAVSMETGQVIPIVAGRPVLTAGQLPGAVGAATPPSATQSLVPFAPGAPPLPPASVLGLGAAPPLTATFEQVLRMRGRARWAAGELWVAETYGGAVNRSPVPTPMGARVPDVPVLGEVGTMVIEVKTYLGWRTVAGAPVRGEVPLTPAIQAQIDKDTYLKARVPGWDPIWAFLDAPPSADLASMLSARGLRWVHHLR